MTETNERKLKASELLEASQPRRDIRGTSQDIVQSFLCTSARLKGFRFLLGKRLIFFVCLGIPDTELQEDQGEQRVRRAIYPNHHC